MRSVEGEMEVGIRQAFHKAVLCPAAAWLYPNNGS